MCLSGHPNLCQQGYVVRDRSMEPRLSQDGRPFEQLYSVGSFAEHMLLHENSLVKIDPSYPLDRAALVGCGVLTGVGAAIRTAQVQPGQTVAVFGCGGVGLSVIQGARIAGAQPHHRRRPVRVEGRDGASRGRDGLRGRVAERRRADGA